MILRETLNGINVQYRVLGCELKPVFKVSTDSRTIHEGDMFVCLVGDKFDGFSYAEDVIKKGAIAIVFESRPNRNIESLLRKYPNVTFVETKDTLVFLQELAREHKRAWDKQGGKTTIALTGSNGKTTHKEMLKHILASVFPGKIHATSGNLNNHIGVPLTLFDLNSDHDVVIVEMGMNHRHEILPLCEIAEPSNGLITNIGQAHIGFLGSMDNIFFEKTDLYRYVMKKTFGLGNFVVNADDKYLRLLGPSTGLLSYSESDNGNIHVDFEDQLIKFNYHGKKVEIRNDKVLEGYNLRNLCTATLLSLKIFPQKFDEIIMASSTYEQPAMNRSEWIGNVFLDAYNANPSSMKTSLDSFLKIMKEKKVPIEECFFILGDMNELGIYAEKLHSEMGKYVEECGIKNVAFIGKFKEFYLKGYPLALGGYSEKEDLLKDFSDFKSKYKWVFIKGSRSVKLEQLLS